MDTGRSTRDQLFGFALGPVSVPTSESQMPVLCFVVYSVGGMRGEPRSVRKGHLEETHLCPGDFFPGRFARDPSLIKRSSATCTCMMEDPCISTRRSCPGSLHHRCLTTRHPSNLRWAVARRSFSVPWHAKSRRSTSSV